MKQKIVPFALYFYRENISCHCMWLSLFQIWFIPKIWSSFFSYMTGIGCMAFAVGKSALLWKCVSEPSIWTLVDALMARTDTMNERQWKSVSCGKSCFARTKRNYFFKFLTYTNTKNKVDKFCVVHFAFVEKFFVPIARHKEWDKIENT